MHLLHASRKFASVRVVTAATHALARTRDINRVKFMLLRLVGFVRRQFESYLWGRSIRDTRASVQNCIERCEPAFLDERDCPRNEKNKLKCRSRSAQVCLRRFEPGLSKTREFW